MKKFIIAAVCAISLVGGCTFANKGKEIKNYPDKDIGKEIKNTSKSDSANTGGLIPKELATYIKANLVKYQFPKIDEYDANWRDYKTDNVPFLCSSDFNGDGKRDYALILIDTSKVEVLFVFNKEGQSYRHFQLEKFKKNNKFGIVLTIQEKGEWASIDESKVVNNDGILVEDIFESKSKAYYWDGEGYTQFLFD